MMESAFQFHELEHLLDRKQRTAVQPEGSSVNGAQLYCGSVLFFYLFSKAFLITRKLSWLLSWWPFCIFPLHSLWRNPSVWHHRLQCGKSSLVSCYCWNYGFGFLKCLKIYVAITHFKAEWWHSLLSTECSTVLDQFNIFLFCVCVCFLWYVFFLLEFFLWWVLLQEPDTMTY